LGRADEGKGQGQRRKKQELASRSTKKRVGKNAFSFISALFVYQKRRGEDSRQGNTGKEKKDQIHHLRKKQHNGKTKW